MDSIRARNKITSSILNIKELEKFKDQDVDILIKPANNVVDKNMKKSDLLNISTWKLSEDERKFRPWQIKGNDKYFVNMK